jgi:bifunctional DNA-binding transcriptional regulator/antitoxin component of YhaV-PrlF toxin-antitoxin module
MDTCIMSKSTDQRGRIYLPKEIRERFGEQYRIVELPSHVALFPVDEDPLEGLREAVGDAFAETPADDLKTEAREAIADEVRADTANRSTEPTK